MAKSSSFAPEEHDHEEEVYASEEEQEEVAENGSDSEGEVPRGVEGSDDDDENEEEEEDDVEVSYLEEEEEDIEAPECDESTLVINLNTPTMMRRDVGNTMLLSNEENFFIPNQTSPTMDRKSTKKPSRRSPNTPSTKQLQAQARAEVEMKMQMSSRRQLRSSVKNSAAVFYNNGSPTTIAPANMHYALGATSGGIPETPSGNLPRDFFDAASLGFQMPGLSEEDLAPMETTEMLRQFTHFTPEKSPGKKNYKPLRKSRSASHLVAEEAVVRPSPLRQSQLQNETPRPITPTNRRPSPKYASTIKEDIGLSVRKVRASPSENDPPEREAKRIRSKSRSPVKQPHQTPRPIIPSSSEYGSSYPLAEAKNPQPTAAELQAEEDREASETVANLIKMHPKTPRESRRRRETLELRQFSREFRDFSVIGLDTLTSLKQQAKQQQGENKENKEVGAPATPTKPIEGPPPSTTPARRRVRPRRSMSGPPVPPHVEAPGTERKKPNPTSQVDIDGMHDNMNEMVARISALEAELALTKSQLSTSQNAHEFTLMELRGEKNARRRAEGIIDFMKMENKFVLEAHVAAVRREVEEEFKRSYGRTPVRVAAAPAPMPTSRSRFQREPTVDHDDDDTRSVTSSRSMRSIRSVNSTDNHKVKTTATTTTSRRQPVTRTAAAAALAPSRSREPIIRPSTTLAMYSAPTRSSARNNTAAATSATTTSDGRKVLTSSTTASVLNQQPILQTKGKYELQKTRQATATTTAATTRPTRLAGQSGPGGAMRPAAGMTTGTGRTGGARR